MNREELLSRVNQVVSQHGWEPVIPRTLRKWVSMGLMDGPTPMGQRRGVPPDWQWSEKCYEQTVRICALKAQGSSRFGELFVRLWLEEALPFNRRSDFKRLQGTLLREFRRARNRMLKPVTAGFDPRTEARITQPRASTIARQLGNASPSLLPDGFRYSEAHLVTALAATQFGETGSLHVGGVPASLESLMLDVFPRFGMPSSLFANTPHLLYVAQHMFSGFIGDPEEIDGSSEEAITRANLDAYEVARCLFCGLREGTPQMPEVLAAINQDSEQCIDAMKARYALFATVLKSPQWDLGVFVLSLQLAFRDMEQARKIADEFNAARSIPFAALIDALRKESRGPDSGGGQIRARRDD